MKSRVVIALLIAGALVISAGAQDNSSRHSIMDVTASLPVEITKLRPMQLQAPSGSSHEGAYLPKMEVVFQALSGELGQIVQAARDGSLTREQATYLSAERYYVGLMRFQLLRVLNEGFQERSPSQSSSQANPPPQITGETITLSPPTSSPDISESAARYLELSPDQIAALQAQIINDRKRVQSLLKRYEVTSRKLISATLKGKFDSNQVCDLATEQSLIMKQLIVENLQLQAKLYKMLTTEQQQKVEELRRQALASLKVTFPVW